MLVSRGDVFARRQFVTVAAVTTRARDIPTEVQLGPAEGLPPTSVVNCDDLRTIPKRILLRRVGALGDARVGELDEALKFALGLE